MLKRRSILCIFGAASLLAAATIDRSIQSAEGVITPAALLAHIKILASDEFGGRGPDSPGEQKTVAYLIEQAKKMGLKPGNPDGTYTQNVTLWGIRSEGSLTITTGGTAMTLTPRQDYVASSQMPQPKIDIANAGLVFAGYGVVAPEFHWDDYKGADVKGKVVVLFTGDPPVPDPNDPSKLDEKMFLGRALSYYGRPATKYETAYAKGAVAVVTLFVPRNGTANLARLSQNAPRETMILRDEASTQRIGAQVTLSMEKAKELFRRIEPGPRRAARSCPEAGLPARSLLAHRRRSRSPTRCAK